VNAAGDTWVGQIVSGNKAICVIFGVLFLVLFCAHLGVDGIRVKGAGVPVGIIRRNTMALSSTILSSSGFRRSS
jgi:hypothetical protein